MLARQSGADLGLVGLRASHLLDGVHRNDAHDGGTGFGGFVDHLVDGFQIDERAHGIVHGHQRGIGIERGQRILDGLLAGVPAFHHAHRLAVDFALEQLRDPLEILGRAARRRSHRTRAERGELADGVQQDGRAIEQHELLPAGARFLAEVRPMRVPSPAAGRMTATFM